MYPGLGAQPTVVHWQTSPFLLQNHVTCLTLKYRVCALAHRSLPSPDESIPAESCVRVLQKDAGVSLRLQHPVPVERVVQLQGTFEILKNDTEVKCVLREQRGTKNTSTPLRDSEAERRLNLDDQCTDCHRLCCALWVFHVLRR